MSSDIDRPLQNAWSAIVDLAIIAAIVVLAVRHEYGPLAILASIAGARFGISAGKTIERIRTGGNGSGGGGGGNVGPSSPPGSTGSPGGGGGGRPGQLLRVVLAASLAVGTAVLTTVPRALGR